MKVYHFLNKEYALSNLSNRWLKVAKLNDLNDPFEFFVTFTRGEEEIPLEESQRIKNNYASQMGFLCFSENYSNPVQWAHYGDSHRGICLEFEVRDTALIKVEYKPRPRVLDVRDNTWKEHFVEATKTKYEHWSYEEERRIVIPLDAAMLLEEGVHTFMPIIYFGKLSGVFKGMRCNLSAEEHSFLERLPCPVYDTQQARGAYTIEKKG